MITSATTSQTVGPYFSIGLDYRNTTALCLPTTTGEHIEVAGRVLDGEGTPIPDAVLELWQADSDGRFAGFNPMQSQAASSGFLGFARVPTDSEGAFRFSTVRPGAVPDLSGKPQAPHICVVSSCAGF